MVRSCPLAELFSAPAQSGCSKAGQSRATKRGVGLDGKSCRGCMKQQNDPFVLRFAVWHQPRAASSVGFPQAIPLPRSRSPAALKLSGALAMFLTTAMLRKKPFRLYVTHFDRHVMTVTPRPRSAETIMR